MSGPTGGYVPLGPSDRYHVRQRFGDVPRTIGIPLVPLKLLHTEVWHEARRAGVGASELGGLIGAAGAHQSPFSLYWHKRAGWEREQTEEMRMGLELEPIAAKVWGEQHPDHYVARPAAALYAAPTTPLCLMCSPDFITVTTPADDTEHTCDDTGSRYCTGCRPRLEPLEVKAYEGGDGWGEPGTDQVPEHIAVQSLVQCHVLGAARGHVVRVRQKKVTSYVIDFTAERAETMLDWETIALRFLASLSEGPVPDIDGSDATTETLSRLYANHDPDGEAWFPQSEVDAYNEAIAILARAKANAALARNVVRARLGSMGKGLTPNGDVFVERRVYKRKAFSVNATLIDGIYPKGARSE